LIVSDMHSPPRSNVFALKKVLPGGHYYQPDGSGLG
jgi:hypothetical protein